MTGEHEAHGEDRRDQELGEARVQIRGVRERARSANEGNAAEQVTEVRRDEEPEDERDLSDDHRPRHDRHARSRCRRGSLRVVRGAVGRAVVRGRRLLCRVAPVKRVREDVPRGAGEAPSGEEHGVSELLAHAL